MDSTYIFTQGELSKKLIEELETNKINFKIVLGDKVLVDFSVLAILFKVLLGAREKINEKEKN